MAHLTQKDGYTRLIDRLNRFPLGAAPQVDPSKTLYAILELLFSSREAELVALLPIKPFTAQQAGRIWKLETREAERVLEELASRAILVDTETPSGKKTYVLPPPMAGFFEFSMMRLRGDLNQHLLGELFYQYMNVEEDFVKGLFNGGETQLGRVFVQEAVLPKVDDLTVESLVVLDYERASEVIRSASHRSIGLCYCRHKMEHAGRACSAPMDICMTFNTTAASLSRAGYARLVDAAEGLDLLNQAQEKGLVQFGENVRQGVNFICNCCGCCCEALVAARKFGFLNPVHTTNYLAQVDEVVCNGCGKCSEACPVEAMTLVSANDPRYPKLRKAKLDEDLCLGCGVCVRACPKNGLSLKSRPERVITPLNSVHRAVMMAVERGLLQELIFDNQVLLSHRMLAAVLGTILRLPPVKRTMASKQMKSVYLERLIEWGTEKFIQ